jgi:hypothetical protein
MKWLGERKIRRFSINNNFCKCNFESILAINENQYEESENSDFFIYESDQFGIARYEKNFPQSKLKKDFIF